MTKMPSRFHHQLTALYPEKKTHSLVDVWRPDVSYFICPATKNGQSVVSSVQGPIQEIRGRCQLNIDIRWIAICTAKCIPDPVSLGKAWIHEVRPYHWAHFRPQHWGCDGLSIAVRQDARDVQEEQERN
jgi:hypothetical protein